MTSFRLWIRDRGPQTQSSYSPAISTRSETRRHMRLRGYGSCVDGDQQGQVLVELRDVARPPREPRRRIADLTAEHGRTTPEHAAAWAAYRVVNARWSALIRRGAAA